MTCLHDAPATSSNNTKFVLCFVKLRLSLLSNPDLRLICFYCFLRTILPTCSASASVAA